MTTEPVLNEEARMDVLAAASRTERGNRPVYLIVLASLLLLASVIYLTIGLVSSAWAESDRLAAANEADAIRREVDALKAIDDQQNSPENNERFQRNQQITGDLKRFADEVKLEGLVLAEQDDSTKGAKGFARRRYHASGLGAVPGDALFAWLGKALEIKGLEVNQIRLSPANAAPDGGARWNADIYFNRWERR